MAKKLGKPPANSCVEMVQQVLPGDTNPHGTVFGGKVMQWIDIAGAVAAMRHTENLVVTASFDQVDFHAPAKNGEIIVLRSQVNYTGRTSMEIGVEVHAEDPLTGRRVLTTDALVTYVAINDRGRPKSVIPLIPKTAGDKRIFAEGKKRAAVRRAERKKRR